MQLQVSAEALEELEKLHHELREVDPKMSMSDLLIKLIRHYRSGKAIYEALKKKK